MRPALRFAAVGSALALLLGAWHFWGQDGNSQSAGRPPATALSTPSVAQPASAPEPSPLMVRLDAAISVIKDNAQALQGLLEGQKSQQAALSKLERDVGELTEGFRQMQARQAAAASAARARQRVAKAAPDPAPKTQAQLLSVDVWDGRPSAVVGAADPADKRVVYLHEGDQSKGITLKRADPGSQQAVFDVAGRDVVLSRDAGR